MISMPLSSGMVHGGQGLQCVGRLSLLSQQHHYGSVWKAGIWKITIKYSLLFSFCPPLTTLRIVPLVAHSSKRLLSVPFITSSSSWFVHCLLPHLASPSLTLLSPTFSIYNIFLKAFCNLFFQNYCETWPLSSFLNKILFALFWFINCSFATNKLWTHCRKKLLAWNWLPVICHWVLLGALSQYMLVN